MAVASRGLLTDRPKVPGTEGLVTSVHDLLRTVVRRMQPTLEEEGISMGQFWGLHAVSSFGPASVNSVAHRLLVSAPTACANMDTLVRAGLLERRRSSSDRRVVQLALTAKGRESEARIWRAIARTMDDATRGLSRSDLAAAERVFRAVVDRLEPPTLPSGPRRRAA